MADLAQARVLILATDGFETVELFEPKKALEAVGAKVTLASIKTDPIQGMKGDIKLQGQEYGLVLDVGGYHKNAFTLAPALTIGYDEMDLFVGLFEALLKRCGN